MRNAPTISCFVPRFALAVVFAAASGLAGAQALPPAGAPPSLPAADAADGDVASDVADGAPDTAASVLPAGHDVAGGSADADPTPAPAPPPPSPGATDAQPAATANEAVAPDQSSTDAAASTGAAGENVRSDTVTRDVASDAVGDAATSDTIPSDSETGDTTASDTAAGHAAPSEGATSEAATGEAATSEAATSEAVTSDTAATEAEGTDTEASDGGAAGGNAQGSGDPPSSGDAQGNGAGAAGSADQPVEAQGSAGAADSDATGDAAAAADAIDAAADAPSAFWLIGTSREARANADDEAVADDPLAARPADEPDRVGPPVPDPEANEYGVSPMTILDTPVPPGSRTRLSWTTGQSFSGTVMETPVIVVHGIKPGPRLCLIAGIHGDELNSVEVVRRLAYKIEPEQLAGTVIAVPIVNLLGFSRGSRYLPDRRDLNRFFPGSPYGSSASRIAHSFFRSVVHHCDALVDFHTGSFDRSNLPQVRGDLTIPSVVEFTRGFGATAVLHSPGAVGMLRQAATTQGIPSVTFEIGAPLRLQPEEIEHGEQAIETLMHKMGMVQARRRWAEPQAVFYESTWIRVDQGGMLFSDVELGDRVDAGQRLGRVIDPVSNRAAEVIADEDGRVIGMALNQLVLPGFAAYHIGVEAGEDRVVNEAERQAAPDDERFLEYDQLDSDSMPGNDFAEPDPGQNAPRGQAPMEDRGDG